jgi:AraC-like DNA-binding protein
MIALSSEVRFCDKIIILDDTRAKTNMPATFSNDVYLSKTRVISTRYVCPFSIKYVHTGADAYKVNGKRTVVTEGSVLIINPDTDLELTADHRKSKVDFNEGMSLFLNPLLVREVFEHQTPRKYWNAMLPLMYDDVIHHDNTFVGFVKQLYHHSRTNTNAVLTEEFYYSIAEQVVKFQLSTATKLSVFPQRNYGARKELLKRLSFARNVINDLDSKPFQLSDIARQASLSKYFLIRNFKCLYGITPQQYHIALRIRKATGLLKRFSVSEVAHQLDYPSVQSFSRQFKGQTDVSPKYFRPFGG